MESCAVGGRSVGPRWRDGDLNMLGIDDNYESVRWNNSR